MIDVKSSLMEVLRNEDLHAMGEAIGVSTRMLQNYKSKKYSACPSAFIYFIIMEYCGYSCTMEKVND